MANKLKSSSKDSHRAIQKQTTDAEPDGRWDRDPLYKDEQQTPSGLRQLVRDHRRSLLALLTIGIVLIFIFAVLPQIAGFGKSLHRLRYGNKLWLAGGVGLECISLAGYMALFRLTFSSDRIRIGWRTSYQIT